LRAFLGLINTFSFVPSLPAIATFKNVAGGRSQIKAPRPTLFRLFGGYRLTSPVLAGKI